MTKAAETANVPFLLNDIDEGWDRRKFIKGVGVAVLTIQFLSFRAH